MRFLVIFLLTAFLLLVGCVQDQLPPIANDATCVNEWKSKNLKPNEDYVPGVIVVGFKETIPESQAREIIGSYGLWVKSILDLTIENEYTIYVYAEVKEGSEFNWICYLLENENVESAELNGIMGESPSYVDFSSCSEASKFVINKQSFPKDQIHSCTSEKNLINGEEIYYVQISGGAPMDCPAGCIYMEGYTGIVSLTNRTSEEFFYPRTQNLSIPSMDESKFKFKCLSYFSDITEYKLENKNNNFGWEYSFTEPLTCSWFEITFVTITMEKTQIFDGFEVTRSWEGSMFSYMIDGNVMWDYEGLETQETKREISSFEEPM